MRAGTEGEYIQGAFMVASTSGLCLRVEASSCRTKIVFRFRDEDYAIPLEMVDDFTSRVHDLVREARQSRGGGQ